MVRLSQKSQDYFRIGGIMFIKSFVTIFLALFYHFVLTTRLVPTKEATIWEKLTCVLLNWSIQALIGANIVVFLYQIWS